MQWKKLIGVIVIFMFFLGCASNRALKMKPESEIINKESYKKYVILSERMRSLEKSIIELRTEVEALRNEIKNIPIRPPLSSFKLPKEITLCGERIFLEDKNIRENLDREFLTSLGNEAQVLLWMKRARRYFPYIEKRLRERNLPDDLKYITITESSLRPYTVSYSGAAGIWQFIASTGERFGMRKGGVIDERFDFFQATEGALSYLKNLFDEFGSWILAIASYNAGENRIRKEIEFQGTRNYFYLDLPLETERYVYKIAVAKIILSDPERYGFYLEERELYQPLQVERVCIEIDRPLPIIDLARSIGFSYKEIKELNLHFLDREIPPGIHFLNLPPGTSQKFWDFFSSWNEANNLIEKIR